MYGMTNAGGGGSGSFKKTATGSLSPAKEFTVSDLSFRPRIVILYGTNGPGSRSHYTFVCVGLFDKNGDLILWRSTYSSNKYAINPDFDTVAVSDNGFSVTFGNFGSNDVWPTAGTGVNVTYFCYG